MSSLPQPLVAYPHSTSTQTASSYKGSYGPVFAVLAVIAVIAVIACIVGRLCARRLCQPKASPINRAHADRDVERGFGMAVPIAKPAAANAGAKKGEARPVGDGKLRGGNASKIHQEKLHGANFGAKPSK